MYQSTALWLTECVSVGVSYVCLCIHVCMYDNLGACVYMCVMCYVNMYVCGIG